MTFDPANPLDHPADLCVDQRLRLAIDFDLAASNVVNLATSPPTVTVKPFMTVATSAADNKLIRVRGPLINSSVDVGTYTVYVRPFFDEVNSSGIADDVQRCEHRLHHQRHHLCRRTPASRRCRKPPPASTMTAASTLLTSRRRPLNAAVTAGKFQFDLRGRRQHARGFLHRGPRRRCDRAQRQHA